MGSSVRFKLLSFSLCAAAATAHPQVWPVDTSAVQKLEAKLQSSRLPEAGAPPC